MAMEQRRFVSLAEAATIAGTSIDTIRATRSRLALAVVLLSAPCTADESPVALRTTGGEAWSFEKLIETSVPAGACDTVAITSPIGTVTVQPEGARLVARVRLGPGDNVVEAECRKDGVRHGTPA